MKRRSAALPVIILALSGCASSLSGVGGDAHYACHAPEGAQCTSVSGVYANSIHGTAQRNVLPETLRPLKTPLHTTATEKSAAEPDPALRSNPRLLRVWIAPWEDSDGDLHEAAKVHMLVDTGHWLIEHVRPARKARPDAVAPPAPAAPDAAGAKPENPLPAVDRGVDHLPIAPALPASSDASMTEH